MTLIEKIPELDDEGLRNLLTNARRLQESGSAKQQEAAAELLPALEEASAAIAGALFTNTSRIADPTKKTTAPT